MITAIVQFKLPNPITPAQALEAFSATAPRYQGVPGLIRKQYLLSEDGQTAGGAYLWKNREDAENFYTEDMRAFIFERYQSWPTITFFETPVVVDNVSGQILAGE